MAREAGTTRDNVIRRITLSPEGKGKGEGGRKPHFSPSTPAARLALTPEDSVIRQPADQPNATGAKPRRELSEEDNAHLADTTRSFWLVDTAGLKTAEDEFETSIQDQINEATEVADVILVVVDGTQYPSDRDRTVAKKALRSKKPVILSSTNATSNQRCPAKNFAAWASAPSSAPAPNTPAVSTSSPPLSSLIFRHLPTIYHRRQIRATR